MKKFLHVGCGSARKDRTTAWFSGDDWEEVRFDIDPDAKPDVVGSMTDMSNFADGEFDGLYSSHNIEHLNPHEVLGTLRNFHRVLSDTGHLVITCPDLQSVCAHVAEGRLLEPLYQSSMGPISALDILFGHRASLAAGKVHMAHRCGFTLQSLAQELRIAGFGATCGNRNPQAFALMCVATKGQVTEEEMREIIAKHFGGKKGPAS